MATDSTHSRDRKLNERYSHSGETGCDLADATVARACEQSDLSYAVQAKREIGRLWEDTDEAPYRVLFNSSVSGLSVWKSVQTLRVSDDAR